MIHMPKRMKRQADPGWLATSTKIRRYAVRELDQALELKQHERARAARDAWTLLNDYASMMTGGHTSEWCLRRKE